MGPGDRLRRHLPPALLLLALATMIVADARPTALVTLPSQQQTIILAIDVSLSMGATTSIPTGSPRRRQPRSRSSRSSRRTRASASSRSAATASLVQPPTEDKESLLAAIDRFELQRGTATGSALYVGARDARSPTPASTLESLTFPGGFYASAAERTRKLDPNASAEPKPIQPVPPGGRIPRRWSS